MKKRLIALLGVLAMGLLMGIPFAVAGPPDEAIGDITSEYMGDLTTFNAFELGPITFDRCKGKGSVLYTAARAAGTYVYYIDVKYANIQPDIGQAWFAGVCSYTTLDGEYSTENVGKWFDIVAWDGGEENPEGDGLSGNWADPLPPGWDDPEEYVKTRVCEQYYKGFGGITSGDIVIQTHAKGLR